MVDRRIGPKINEIHKVAVPAYEVEVLENGTQLINIPLGTSELTSVEIIHKGGRFLEQKKGGARATARLLREGTTEMTSKEVAESIDFFGATLNSGAQLDYSYLKLFSLSRYMPDLLPILREMRYDPIFPERELERYIDSSKENLKIQLNKNDVLSYRALTEELYGHDHPYGYNSDFKLYESLSVEDVQAYYNSAYGASNSVIVVSGKVDDALLHKIREDYGSVFQEVRMDAYPNPPAVDAKRINIPTQDKSQTSLRIGMPLFTRNHPDYASFYMLHTILGGYFGSRLMKRIREEKGYTYGVYSSLDTMIYDGYFSISTDVNSEYVEDTRSVIHEEMDRLCHEVVNISELKMVKNYINGSILNLIDGPFKIGGIAKVIALNNLEKDFFERFSAAITAMDAETIKTCAQRYFGNRKMVEVVVGSSE